ncbi:MAG: type I DNA topoisomerase [Bacteroidales bacterium]|nr:type I DNA topoisomerase [Bacteroidales bacterium]
MEENLVIVESPAKAKTITKFLGKNFLVKSSFGHIRDLAKKDFGIDIKNNFKPNYEISPDKKKIVAELKKLVKETKIIWLASDEDREGEAIAWHLSEVLKLDEEKTRRIVFHEITKEAINKAIQEPRKINKDLVEAQQARRILDRLVGFELSPVLWKKIKPALSAGRVQSVAVRLIVEREREIIAFKSDSSYKINAIFSIDNKKEKTEFNAELSEKLKTKKETIEFLKKCINADFIVNDITTKPLKKSPPPPFTTSTLQQEASRKFGFSVSQTMSIAQKLYEAGKITYMRTDSVNLSNLALASAKKEIVSLFGDKYSCARKYKTKSKSAQEAHEAIRPTYLNQKIVSGNNAEKKLYELIWKRAIASQMTEAKLEKTTVNINISKSDKKFVATGEVLKFDGFLKLYYESTNNNNEEEKTGLLPEIKVNDRLIAKYIFANERFTYHPPRYTEAGLVKKMEELGIGRPSTYAPTISTIQNRGYVVKEDRYGFERKYNYLELENDNIKEIVKKEKTGVEKSKLFPTDIGMVVNDFLAEHFIDILDYNFTANVEKEFDEIAKGKLAWDKMIENFYCPFHKKIEYTIEKSKKSTGERKLGIDPLSEKSIYVKIGRYGPMAQIGESGNDEKPKFASLLKGQHIETITLEEALDLFKLPREVGLFENENVVVGIGRFGPYVRHKSSFYSLKKGVDDPMSINIERAIEIINEKRENEKKKLIKEFSDDKELKVLNGRWGAYISYKKKNYKIPKNIAPEKLTLEESLKIINSQHKENKKFGKKTKTVKNKKTKSKTK